MQEDSSKRSPHLVRASAQGTTFDNEGFSLTCAAHSETMPPPKPRCQTLGSISETDASYEIIAAESSLLTVSRPVLF